MFKPSCLISSGLLKEPGFAAKHHTLGRHVHPPFAGDGPDEMTSLGWEGCIVGGIAFPRVTGYQQRSAVCGTWQENNPQSQGHCPPGSENLDGWLYDE